MVRRIGWWLWVALAVLAGCDDASSGAGGEADAAAVEEDAGRDAGVLAPDDAEVVAPDAAAVPEAAPDAAPTAPDAGRPDAGPPDPDAATPDAGARCTPDSCSGRGPCDDATGEVVCDCDEGYTGPDCGDCADGFHREDALCVVDAVCEPLSCSARGACDDSGGVVACDCDPGYAGDQCEDCADGFHPDGEGDCTDDPCRPNPCDVAGQGVCERDGADFGCACDPGFHFEGAVCVEDQACMPNTCGGRGACDDATGDIVCACDPGHDGDRCERCTDGFHPDGLGGCTDDPCLPNPCDAANRTICVAAGDGFGCGCDPGFHLEEDACVEDEACVADSCTGRGACDDAGGIIVCDCEAGYDGDHCDACAAGFHPDGEGGCTDDPCVPNPCEAPDRGVCSGERGSDVFACGCDPGFHLEGDACVEDQACGPNSCRGRGACDDAGGVIACDCMPAYDGDRCEVCADGFHPNGVGGCTDDPCLPNPCDSPNRGVCDGDRETGQFTCGCDVGFHLEGDACVMDEVCAPDTCNGRGACEVVAGLAVCSCGPAYDGPRCAVCADGFHPDGAGGCTDDPCTPNPCDAPNRSVCARDGADFTCACDAGFHLEGDVCVVDAVCMAQSCGGRGTCDDAGGVIACDCDPGYDGDRCDACADGFHPDGTGGCTDDPCLPNPCADQNQACRDNAGAAECFDPPCEAPGVCFSARVERGVCIIAERVNGADCSTSACLADQTCLDGACVGGDDVVCDDRNPCTRDFCDDVAGCDAENDDALVPDDGIDCTADSCSGGVASNAPDNGLCDDTLYCNGAERCVAGQGCVDGAAPQAPPAPASPCRLWGACDEATDDFPLLELDPGTLCDDGLVCTTNDVCDADGVCRGEAIEGCPGDACEILDGVPAVFDIPAASVFGDITVDGGALPDRSPTSDGVIFYLVSQSTGAWHQIHAIGFGGCCGNYTLRGGDDRYDVRVLPGVYDLYLRRDWNSESNLADETAVNDALPRGLRVLRSGFVVGPGANRLDIDIPSTTVTGTVTVGGAALPDRSVTSDGLLFYLRSRDTGAWHRIHSVGFGGCCGNYTLIEDDRTYASRVLPGTYDVLYRRDWNSETLIADVPSTGEIIPKGLRVLAEDVVIADGVENVLDIDVPTADLTGHVTIDGAELPAVSPTSDGALFYLVDRETGARHTLHGIGFGGCCGNYTLIDDDRDYSARVMPGTYDLYYRRDWNSETHFADITESNDVIPRGWRVLRENVVVPAGPSVLDLDIPTADVTGSVTVDGGPLPDVSPTSDGVLFYLRSQDTGAWHTIHGVGFGGCCGNYTLREADRAYASRVLPGRYDLYYRRDWNSETHFADVTAASDALPRGWRILQRDVDIVAGANALDLDVTSVRIQGDITVDGGALPERSPTSDGLLFYLRSQDTGAWHTIHGVGFGGCCGNYTLVEDDRSYDSRVPAGRYDLYYRRDWNSETNVADETRVNDPYPRAWRILATDLDVQSGAGGAAYRLDIDVPSIEVAGAVRIEGAEIPERSPTSDGMLFYAIARDTGAWHRLHGVGYGGCCGNYSLIEDDRTFTARLVPGTYDLLYRRDWNSETNIADETQLNDPGPRGLDQLGVCVDVTE